MSAPLMYEPTDEADMPVIPVSASMWERIAQTIGARVELDAVGPDVCLFNGRAYVAVPL